MTFNPIRAFKLESSPLQPNECLRIKKGQLFIESKEHRAKKCWLVRLFTRSQYNQVKIFAKIQALIGERLQTPMDLAEAIQVQHTYGTLLKFAADENALFQTTSKIKNWFHCRRFIEMAPHMALSKRIVQEKITPALNALIHEYESTSDLVLTLKALKPNDLKHAANQLPVLKNNIKLMQAKIASIISCLPITSEIVNTLVALEAHVKNLSTMVEQVEMTLPPPPPKPNKDNYVFTNKELMAQLAFDQARAKKEAAKAQAAQAPVDQAPPGIPKLIPTPAAKAKRVKDPVKKAPVPLVAAHNQAGQPPKTPAEIAKLLTAAMEKEDVSREDAIALIDEAYNHPLLNTLKTKQKHQMFLTKFKKVAEMQEEVVGVLQNFKNPLTQKYNSVEELIVYLKNFLGDGDGYHVQNPVNEFFLDRYRAVAGKFETIMESLLPFRDPTTMKFVKNAELLKVLKNTLTVQFHAQHDLKKYNDEDYMELLDVLEHHQTLVDTHSETIQKLSQTRDPVTKGYPNTDQANKYLRRIAEAVLTFQDPLPFFQTAPQSYAKAYRFARDNDLLESFFKKVFSGYTCLDGNFRSIGDWVADQLITEDTDLVLENKSGENIYKALGEHVRVFKQVQFRKYFNEKYNRVFKFKSEVDQKKLTEAFQAKEPPAELAALWTRDLFHAYMLENKAKHFPIKHVAGEVTVEQFDDVLEDFIDAVEPF